MVTNQLRDDKTNLNRGLCRLCVK